MEMSFHGNQVSWGINHSFISLYSKYQPPSFICSPIMLAPVFSSLDEIYCTKMLHLTQNEDILGKNLLDSLWKWLIVLCFFIIFLYISSNLLWEVNYYETRPNRPTMCPLWMNVFMNECFLWMNVICEWINDWMNELLDVCFFYWSRTTFLLKKCLILMFLTNALPTNQPTDQDF